MLVDGNQVPEGAEVAPTRDEATPEATPAAETQSAPAEGSAADAITLEAAEMHFAPTEVTIPANTDVTIRINNVGVLPHNFSVIDQGVSVDFEPGQDVEVTLNLPPGTYEFICDIPGHSESGMVGTLIVE